MLLKHELTSEEHLQGMMLTDLQRKVIQNRAIEYMEELLLINPGATDNYDARFNFVRGQIAELSALLETDTKAREHLASQQGKQGE